MGILINKGLEIIKTKYKNNKFEEGFNYSSDVINNLKSEVNNLTELIKEFSCKRGMAKKNIEDSEYKEEIKKSIFKIQSIISEKDNSTSKSELWTKYITELENNKSYFLYKRPFKIQVKYDIIDIYPTTISILTSCLDFIYIINKPKEEDFEIYKRWEEYLKEAIIFLEYCIKSLETLLYCYKAEYNKELSSYYSKLEYSKENIKNLRCEGKKYYIDKLKMPYRYIKEKLSVIIDKSELVNQVIIYFAGLLTTSIYQFIVWGIKKIAFKE